MDDKENAIRASVSRASIDKRDEATVTVAEDRVRAHDEFTPQEYSRLIRKVDFILMVGPSLPVPASRAELHAVPRGRFAGLTSGRADRSPCS